MMTLLLLLGLLAARAGGFPLTGGDTERSLLTGQLLPSDAANGTWVADSRGVRLARSGRGWSYWLPESTFSSGMVRARVTLGPRPDFTLLLRATADPTEPQSLSGYGVSVEHDKLVMYRWDDGVVRQMGASVEIEGLLDRAALEIVAYLIGPQLIATVYDAETLDLLGTVAMRDVAWDTGRVGWRAFDKQDAETVLTHLSVQEPRSPPSDPTLFGSERLVEIPATDLPLVPDEIYSGLLFDEPAGAAILTDPAGVERLRRAGVTIRSERSEIPFWAVDSDYRGQRGRPPERTERGFRLDRSYKDGAMVEAILRGYAELYPQLCRLEELGRSSQGRPILALRISDNPGRDEGEPMVLLNASHHSNELLSIDYALDAVRLLLEGQDRAEVRRWTDALDIWVVPLVNPDGNYMFTNISRSGGRKNNRDTNENGVIEPWDGVDLNRNYPFRWGSAGEVGSKSWRHSGQYRGPEAGSEAETQAMMALARRYHPVAVLSWHTNATVILSPYTIDDVDNPEPDAPWALAEAMSEAAGVQPSGRPYKVRRKLYSVDGVDQDWHYFEHGSAAYIIEGSHRRPSDPEVRQASIDGVRPLLTTLLDRIIFGPTLSLSVVDSRGRPLDAVVTIDEITLRSGERWSSRAHDGRFDQLLPAPGRYTVRASKPGYRDATSTVEVTEGRPAELQLVLRGRGR